MATSPRLKLAEMIAAELRLRERRNFVAVGLYGSVARGEDRTHSDVDLLVVVRKKRATIQHLVRAGTLVTILQQTPAEARAEVTGPRADLNAALGGWQSMQLMYDPSGLLSRLTKRAKHPTREQFRQAARHAFLETYEDLGKLRNAIDANDEGEAREMAIWYTDGAMDSSSTRTGTCLGNGRRAFCQLCRNGPQVAPILRPGYETPQASR